MIQLKHSIAAALTLIVLILESGCSTISYDHTFDPNFDLRYLKTFSTTPLPQVPEWDKSPRSILASENLSLDFIKSALETKGYKYVENGEVDFEIQVRVESMNSKNFSANIRSDLASSWIPEPPPHKTDQGYAKDIEREHQLQAPQREPIDPIETYLIIEAVETNTSSIAWKGWAKSSNFRQFKGRINSEETISMILEQFPN